jgi:4-amino-4-deoxychorismate lyase
VNAALYEGLAVEPTLAQSRGLHYGDGVFRTLLVHDGRALDLDLHLEQLEQDCGRLHLRPAPRSILADEVTALAREQASAVLKIILSRKRGARGYRANSDEAERLLLRSAAPSYPTANWDAGIRAVRSPVSLAIQPALAGAKHLNRLEQVLASRDWPAGVDEALMSDSEGRIVCGTRSNLFWASADGLRTAALSRCGVSGVTRRKIIDLAKQLDVPMVIVDAPWTALATAAEAFVCNSLIGIWPLREIDGRALPAPGPLTHRLAAALGHPRLAK